MGAPEGRTHSQHNQQRRETYNLLTRLRTGHPWVRRDRDKVKGVRVRVTDHIRFIPADHVTDPGHPSSLRGNVTFVTQAPGKQPPPHPPPNRIPAVPVAQG